MNKPKFNLDEIRGGGVGMRRLRVESEEKSPTLTFIGGLVIGLVVGGLIGAVIEGVHLLNVLGVQ